MPRKAQRAQIRQKMSAIVQQPDPVASGCAEGTYNHETLFYDQETWVPTCQAPSHLDQSTWCQLNYTDGYNHQSSVAFSLYCNGLISGYQPPQPPLFDLEENFNWVENGHNI
ncbi:hypothetical protein GcM1_230006 [Golovinomyces cichoracearum]|uniref:Uncharacterized protein n=1 Tax=Golovinomyces cichoracearum TaxID=62708 RepID=A0A420IMZ6_9PEZI|nr:hypothetical protein GcM1_230006 [Golovinomyces cichoracearum]